MRQNTDQRPEKLPSSENELKIKVERDEDIPAICRLKRTSSRNRDRRLPRSHVNTEKNMHEIVEHGYTPNIPSGGRLASMAAEKLTRIDS